MVFDQLFNDKGHFYLKDIFEMSLVIRDIIKGHSLHQGHSVKGHFAKGHLHTFY